MMSGFGHQMIPQQSVVSENIAVSSIRTVSNEVFREYDKFKLGEITDMSVGQMLRDIYKLINTNFEPTPRDIADFKALLDIDDDEKLTRSDIETSVNKYLGYVQELPESENKKKGSMLDMSRREMTSMNDLSHSVPNLGDNYTDGTYYKSYNN